jgi:hypothetical protein
VLFDLLAIASGKNADRELRKELPDLETGHGRSLS